MLIPEGKILPSRAHEHPLSTGVSAERLPAAGVPAPLPAGSSPPWGPQGRGAMPCPHHTALAGFSGVTDFLILLPAAISTHRVRQLLALPCTQKEFALPDNFSYSFPGIPGAGHFHPKGKSPPSILFLQLFGACGCECTQPLLAVLHAPIPSIQNTQWLCVIFKCTIF